MIGSHQCVGQLLARLGGECVLSALVPRCGDRDHRAATAALQQYIARIGRPLGDGMASVAIHFDSMGRR